MPVLFANGMFNYVDPVLHLQIYIWGWVLLLVLTAISAIIHHFARWKPLAPFHGLYYEYKNGGNAAFIFDGDLRGEMVAERTAKCIFDYSKVPYILPTDNVPVLGKLYRWIFYYPTAYEGVHIDFVHALVYKFGGVNKDVEIARALQNGEWERNPSVICAGVPVDIIIDTDNWTIPHSRQHKAIESAADMWNETNPTDQIHSYSKFQKYLLEGKIACDGIKRESLCEWVRVDGSLPTDLKDNEFAGKKMQMAITADEIDSRFLNGLGIKVLVGGIGFGALLIVARLLTTFLM
jgi:hypothetical protein